MKTLEDCYNEIGKVFPFIVEFTSAKTGMVLTTNIVSKDKDGSFITNSGRALDPKAAIYVLKSAPLKQTVSKPEPGTGKVCTCDFRGSNCFKGCQCGAVKPYTPSWQ